MNDNEMKAIFDFSKTAMTSMEFFSAMNGWIDFIVIIPEVLAENARLVVGEAYSKWCEMDDECYGDIIESALQDAGIPFLIIYYSGSDDNEDLDLWMEIVEDYIRPDKSYIL